MSDFTNCIPSTVTLANDVEDDVEEEEGDLDFLTSVLIVAVATVVGLKEDEELRMSNDDDDDEDA